MISSARIQDAYSAINFAGDVQALHGQLAGMQAKIARYGAAAAAVQAGTATEREAIFAALVQDVIDASDIARIAALAPLLATLLAELEANYQDFINPQ